MDGQDGGSLVIPSLGEDPTARSILRPYSQEHPQTLPSSCSLSDPRLQEDPAPSLRRPEAHNTASSPAVSQEHHSQVGKPRNGDAPLSELIKISASSRYYHNYKRKKKPSNLKIFLSRVHPSLYAETFPRGSRGGSTDSDFSPSQPLSTYHQSHRNHCHNHSNSPRCFAVPGTRPSNSASRV